MLCGASTTLYLERVASLLDRASHRATVQYLLNCGRSCIEARLEPPRTAVRYLPEGLEAVEASSVLLMNHSISRDSAIFMNQVLDTSIQGGWRRAGNNDLRSLGITAESSHCHLVVLVGRFMSSVESGLLFIIYTASSEISCVWKALSNAAASSDRGFTMHLESTGYLQNM